MRRHYLYGGVGVGGRGAGPRQPRCGQLSPGSWALGHCSRPGPRPKAVIVQGTAPRPQRARDSNLTGRHGGSGRALRRASRAGFEIPRKLAQGGSALNAAPPPAGGAASARAGRSHTTPALGDPFEHLGLFPFQCGPFLYLNFLCAYKFTKLSCYKHFDDE